MSKRVQSDLVDRAVELAERGDADEAVVVAQSALKIGVGTVADLLALGSILARFGDASVALGLFAKAAAIETGNVEAARGLAMTHRFLGDSERAEQAFDRVLSLAPHDYEAQFLRSSLRTQTLARNHTPELKAYLNGAVRTWRGAVHIAFALSKELEDLNQTDEAFFHLASGARIQRQHMNYDIADDISMIESLIATFIEPTVATTSDANLKFRPIFIVGLPRSGTTLVERIVGSHPLVESIGESPAFPLALNTLLTKYDVEGELTNRLDMPQRSLDIDAKLLGDAYLTRARGPSNQGSIFVDKLPLNFLNVALIARSLPSAKIVHVTRHPVAACFSMYKQLFNQAYPFSYDLEECGQYYGAYHRLMSHWNKILPGRLIEISYDDLVKHPTVETARLLEKLNLEWNDCCIKFNRNDAPSRTASASQVRKPIYTSSLNSWRKFGRHLAPLIDRLRQEGVTV